MEIANPIYDVVFKYMMEDNIVAKLLISSIIGEEIIELEPKPQEHTREKNEDGEEQNPEISNLTVYHLDFSAKIKTETGYKLVIIEMQKAELPSDIMRFRRYLGQQYIDSKNSIKEESDDAMQIYTIYFLGYELEICDTPVLSILPEIIDVSTGEVIKRKNKFIESLNHKCWIIQISCLKKRRRNELEKLLAVFDQSNTTSDIHILNVREEDFSEKHRPIIRRLQGVAGSSAMKRRMREEDEVLSYFRMCVRIEYAKEVKEMEKVMIEDKKALEENKKVIEEKDKALEENKKVIEEKDKALEETEKIMAEKDREIAELKRQLGQ